MSAHSLLALMRAAAAGIQARHAPEPEADAHQPQRAAQLRRWSDPEKRRAHAARMRELWSDPAARARRVARMKHARQQREGKR